MRAHEGIKNRLHWVPEVVFHDDLARRGTGHRPENMATVKHLAINLVVQARPNTNLENRRQLAAWNPNYLDTPLRQIARGAVAARGRACDLAVLARAARERPRCREQLGRQPAHYGREGIHELASAGQLLGTRPISS